MNVTILPSKAKGRMNAPPSKSMAHRLLICAGFAEGTSLITNVDPSEDILATIDCLRALGAEVTFENGTVTIKGVSLLEKNNASAQVSCDSSDSIAHQDSGEKSRQNASRNSGVSCGNGSDADSREISGQNPGRISGVSHGNGSDADFGEAFEGTPLLPCRECGSTLRFMIPACLMSGQPRYLSGSTVLLKRPLTVYEKICADQGLLFRKEEDRLLLCGKLAAGRYEIPGNISSQFISGLLFVLPLLQEDSLICLTGAVESRPYILMTMRALEAFGIRTRWEDDRTIAISGGQKYSPRNLRVEGDYSNAAFFEALNLAGGRVVVDGLDEDSLQGDKIYRRHLAELDRGFAEIDLSDCPDLGPVLMAAAALRHGAKFTGTKRLKIKESDRGAAMKQELAKMGVRTDLSENEIRVFPGAKHPEEILDGHNDHRIVMSLAVMLTAVGGTISGAEAVRKSLPDFFIRLERLGTGVIYDELDQ